MWNEEAWRVGFLSLMPRNLGYFLVGRHFGLLPFFFPGVVAIWLFLAARRERLPWQWSTLGVVALSVVVLSGTLPYSWSGGGGPPGNRYFLSIYPALLFLTAAGDVVRSCGRCVGGRRGFHCAHSDESLRCGQAAIPEPRAWIAARAAGRADDAQRSRRLPSTGPATVSRTAPTPSSCCPCWTAMCIVPASSTCGWPERAVPMSSCGADSVSRRWRSLSARRSRTGSRSVSEATKRRLISSPASRLG